MNNVSFCKEVYDRHALLYTISQFDAICTVRITEKQSEFVCEFENKSDLDDITIIREFENYMIDYINSEKVYVDN